MKWWSPAERSFHPPQGMLARADEQRGVKEGWKGGGMEVEGRWKWGVKGGWNGW